MEITCQQCSTVFTIDMVAAPGQVIEVVCPGCFQLHKVVGPPAPPPPEAGAESSSRADAAKSPLGDGGVADRLRSGFTLGLEVRHASWPEPRCLNPFEIERLIYEGQLDGSEEFRENAGRWYSIGEHPDFALVFQLVGRPVMKPAARADGSPPRFSGWRSVPPPLPPPGPVAPQPSVDAQVTTPVPVLEPELPESSSPSSGRRWLPILIVVLVLAAVAVLVALRGGF